MPPGDRGRRVADRVRRRHGPQADAAVARAGRAVLSAPSDLVWYAGYGSNLSPDRFESYLRGGRPDGATRTYPGAREPVDALDVRPVTLPGRLSFAWKSPTWGGGIAFFSPAADGEVRATAYLITARQFSDVFAQEMWREPGVDLDLAPLLASGRHAVGEGRYETLHVAGTVEDRPVLTFSAPDVTALGLRPPAAAYLTTMIRGLRTTHGLSTEQTVDYLLTADGINAHVGDSAGDQAGDRAWDHDSLSALVTSLAP